MCGLESRDAHRLVELERAAGAPPPEGCAWLEEGTLGDLELDEVVADLDRTVSPVGAQQLWRIVAAPAQRVDVLSAREQAVASLADRSAREPLRAVLSRIS